MIKKNLSFLLILFICTHSFARNYTDYKSLDRNDPIIFGGNHIIYQGKRITLNDKTFFIDGQLSDVEIANTPYVFNSITKALKQIQDGSESELMTLYIAPYVYWIDDPDDLAIRKPVDGGIPYGQIVKCNWLRFYGLTTDPQHVVLASQRGQTQGAEGNFTMFYFDGNGISSENVTFGNYCNVDLEYPLLPKLNRSKRSSTIAQAQLIICNSDKVVARNTHFISRLNLCPFAGAKRILFDNCYFESTDDALCGTGVYLNSKFTFFSSKPFYRTQGTGAAFLNCDFDVLTKEKQYLAKVGSPVAIVDSRLKSSSEPLYVGWTQDPTDDLRCYQYNVSLNGTPLLINQNKPENTVDMTGKPVLEAYRIEHEGKVIYNTYNLLRGNDDWDPMGVKEQIEQIEKQTGKNLTNIPTYLRISPSVASVESGVTTAMFNVAVMRFGNYTYEDQSIRWSATPDDKKFIALTPADQDNSCKIEGVNDQEETKQAIVHASTAIGLESAALLTVAPKYLEAPRFTSFPRIVKAEKGMLKVDYVLDLEGREDQSLITWYRSDDKREVFKPVSVSRLNQPEYTYQLSDADIGYYIAASVEPKHLRCHPGKPEVGISTAAIAEDDIVLNRDYYTDFQNFPVNYQPQIIPGFWTVDGYKPSDLGQYNWIAPTESTWYYGKGQDGMKGMGLMQAAKGARLLYTPVERVYTDMSVTLNVDPGKQAGQGFGSATGQYMEIYIKYDTRTLTGYGLRIIRTTKYDHAVDFILMKYENGQAIPITAPVSSACYRTGCTISLSVKGNKLIAHAETTTKLPVSDKPELVAVVDLQADILPGSFGGVGIQHTGSVGASATMLHWLNVNWK